MKILNIHHLNKNIGINMKQKAVCHANAYHLICLFGKRLSLKLFDDTNCKGIHVNEGEGCLIGKGVSGRRWFSSHYANSRINKID